MNIPKYLTEIRPVSSNITNDNCMQSSKRNQFHHWLNSTDDIRCVGFVAIQEGSSPE
jgi:hypothetical protein